jgi:hypothetical protein
MSTFQQLTQDRAVCGKHAARFGLVIYSNKLATCPACALVRLEEAIEKELGKF